MLMRQILFDVKWGQKRQTLFEAKWGRYCLISNEANTIWCQMRPNEANTVWRHMRPKEADTVWRQMRPNEADAVWGQMRQIDLQFEAKWGSGKRPWEEWKVELSRLVDYLTSRKLTRQLTPNFSCRLVGAKNKTLGSIFSFDFPWLFVEQIHSCSG